MPDTKWPYWKYHYLCCHGLVYRALLMNSLFLTKVWDSTSYWSHKPLFRSPREIRAISTGISHIPSFIGGVGKVVSWTTAMFLLEWNVYIHYEHHSVCLRKPPLKEDRKSWASGRGKERLALSLVGPLKNPTDSFPPTHSFVPIDWETDTVEIKHI